MSSTKIPPIAKPQSLSAKILSLPTSCGKPLPFLGLQKPPLAGPAVIQSAVFHLIDSGLFQLTQERLSAGGSDEKNASD
jgi:hypothetical protein